jgi:hypothetical protein
MRDDVMVSDDVVDLYEVISKQRWKRVHRMWRKERLS